MDKLLIGITDKILAPWLEGKDYMSVSDEGEAVGVAAGYWLATGKRADVFMSNDGFCNAMNFLTSWIIPKGIEMNIRISTGREEPSHKIMTDILEDLLKLLKYDPAKIDFQIMRK